MTEVTNLIKQELVLEVELCETSEHVVGAKLCEDVVKKEFSTVKWELATRLMDCANLR